MSRGDDNLDPREALDRLFLDPDRAEDEADAARLFGAIAESDAARDRFDRLAIADRVISGDEESPGAFEREFGEAAFMGALDEMLAREAAADDAVEGESADGEGAEVITLWSTTTRVVALAAAVALAVGAVVMIGTQGEQPRDDEFQPRSAVIDRPDSNYEKPVVEVFCVERSDDGVRFRGKKDSEFDVVRCGRDAEIKLAIANPNPELKYASFFGAAQDGSIYWYGPSPAARSALRVEAGAELKPIGETIRLGVNHSPGPVRVHAVVTEEPVDFGEFEELVRAQKARLFEGSCKLGDRRGATASVVYQVESNQ